METPTRSEATRPADPGLTDMLPRSFVVGGAAWAAIVLLDGALALFPPRPGESVAVRWLRMLPEHPLRSALAVALLIDACTRRVDPRGQSGSLPNGLTTQEGGVPLGKAPAGLDNRGNCL